MYQFQYVTKNETKTLKNEIIELIHLVQDDVRDEFTFNYEFIGSESRNMVTWDPNSNVGFDFDVNLRVNDDDEDYSAQEIKQILMAGFNKYARKYKYDFCEDSTRVFTIKVKDRKNSRVLHSCDFAIVYDCMDGRQQYIRFNKPTNYTWEYQQDGFYQLPRKVSFCKENGYWQGVRDLYLDKKNRNADPHKKSRTIYAEAVHQICQINGYYDKDNK